MADVEHASFEGRLQQLMVALEASLIEDAGAQLDELHPSEVAKLLEALTPKDRSLIWPRIKPSVQGEALKDVNEDVQTQLIDEMSVEALVKAAEGLDTDDLADIVPNLPETAVHSLLLTLDYKHREHLKKVLTHHRHH